MGMDHFAQAMGAKAKRMAQAWDQASLRQTTTLGITFDLKMKVPAQALKIIQYEIMDDLKKNLYAGFPAVEAALNEAMESPVWEWNGVTTKRENGDVVGTPRDIVDTGKLKESLQIRANNLGLIVSYNTPYAAIVHYGGITWNGGFISDRPWAEAVLLGGGPVSQINWAALLQGLVS